MMNVNRYKYIDKHIDSSIIAAPSSTLDSDKRSLMQTKLMRYKSMYDQIGRAHV